MRRRDSGAQGVRGCELGAAIRIPPVGLVWIGAHTGRRITDAYGVARIPGHAFDGAGALALTRLTGVDLSAGIAVVTGGVVSPLTSTFLAFSPLDLSFLPMTVLYR